MARKLDMMGQTSPGHAWVRSASLARVHEHAHHTATVRDCGATLRINTYAIVD